MFVLESDITIGDFRFSGVNEVQIQSSLHSIADIAIIQIPSVARVMSNGKLVPGSVITAKQFADGDPVVIKLGYNGNLQTEFKGFVKRCDLNMPLRVECEGYSWLLRRNTINGFYENVSVKELLNFAVSGIDAKYNIQVQCDVEIYLSNLLLDNLSGFDIINNISKYTDGNLSCFFLQPDILWCGFVYTPCADGIDVLNTGIVTYRLGYNVVKNNDLKVRSSENDPVEVTYIKKLSSGEKLFQVSDVFKKFSRKHSWVLNHIKDALVLKRLVNEKAYRINYTGFEGSISPFLQPYATPGFKAYITDDRYPEQDGTYLVESMIVKFGTAGARRILELGPKFGFAK